MEPNNVTALNAKGLALSNLGKYDKAIESYDEVLELEPNNVTALNRTGEALEGQGRDQESSKYFDKVGEIYASKDLLE